MTKRQSLYDQIGGEKTVSNIVDNLFDTRLPADTSAEPPIWDLFSHVRQSEATLAMHKEFLGSFIGSTLGDVNPKHTIDDQDMMAWHRDVHVLPEHFDVFTHHLVEASKDETGQHAEAVAEAIGSVALELRSVVVQNK